MVVRRSTRRGPDARPGAWGAALPPAVPATGPGRPRPCHRGPWRPPPLQCLRRHSARARASIRRPRTRAAAFFSGRAGRHRSSAEAHGNRVRLVPLPLPQRRQWLGRTLREIREDRSARLVLGRPANGRPDLTDLTGRGEILVGLDLDTHPKAHHCDRLCLALQRWSVTWNAEAAV